MTFPLYIYSSLFFNSFVFCCCCFFFADDFNLFLAASLWFRFQNGIFTKNPDKCFSSLLPGYFQLFLRFLCSCWDLIIPAFLICFLKSLFWISFFNLFGACNHRIQTKRTGLKNLKSDLTLTMSYFNPALNNLTNPELTIKLPHLFTDTD